MRRYLGIFVFALLLPNVSRGADDAPEKLLPAGTQVYFRWDGNEAHQAAYDKTALAKMMRGETGHFVSGVIGQVQEVFGSVVTTQQLLGGVPPEKLQKLQIDAFETLKLVGTLSKRGVIVGIELRKVEPPEIQATLIIPNAGTKSTPLLATIRLVAGLFNAETKEATLSGRKVVSWQNEGLHVASWSEGPHAILTVGTDTPSAIIGRFDGKQAGPTETPLFKKVSGFTGFETGARAFIDVAGIAKVAQTRGKEMAKLIDDLGLDSLKSVILYSGYEGDTSRSLLEVDMPGPRKGIMRLAGGKPFTLAELPPFPPEAVSWSMSNLDTGLVFDVGLQAIEAVVGLLSADDVPKIKGFIKQVDDALGINLRNDLIASLGNRYAEYTTPSDGPLTFGQTYLFRVKDGKKFEKALDRAVKGLAKTTGLAMSIKRNIYHGAVVREVHVKQQGFFFVPSYAIHKDWLIVSYFPQAVRGCILRMDGKLPVWKPSRHVQAAFAALPKDIISVSVADPRPTVKQVLAIAPLIGAVINSFNPDFKFDVGLLPNADEATHHLFPNVSVTTDEGGALRRQSRSSLELPLDLAGIDSYVAFGALAFSLQFFAMR